MTLLHHVCVVHDYRGRDGTEGAIERATILLDAGASIFARDDEYRSTPPCRVISGRLVRLGG